MNYLTAAIGAHPMGPIENNMIFSMVVPLSPNITQPFLKTPIVWKDSHVQNTKIRLCYNIQRNVYLSLVDKTSRVHSYVVKRGLLHQRKRC